MQSIMETVSQARKSRWNWCVGLRLYDVIHHHPDGKDLIQQLTVSDTERTLAKNVQVLVARPNMGRAMTTEVVGTLAPGLSIKVIPRSWCGVITIRFDSYV
jgi:hypothetical protein